jgi:hypothetical protein
MPSLGDMPNEVLSKIPADSLTLLALVLVNHHFYDVFVAASTETLTKYYSHTRPTKEMKCVVANDRLPKTGL